MPHRIGIDTGGTFTDLVLVMDGGGIPVTHKVASTPDDPARAMMDGILGILDKAGCTRSDITLLVHGTTVATNTLLQRRGAKTAFVTTAGFRDILHIQRQDRPGLYDLRSRRAEPLVPRELRFELEERVLFDGSVRTAVDGDGLQKIIDQLKAHDVEAVAVGFLHSYANPDHEREVGRALVDALPGVSVSLSHDLVREHGEYERFSTVVINAYVRPSIARYLSGLEHELAAAGITAPLAVMKSNGGIMAAPDAARQCVHTILSGPAGGVVAGAALAERLQLPNIITADMGGTSFDVAVVRDGHVAFARDAEIGGLATKVPMLDIHTVGAGGGSIAWVDAGGALRVGPQSAGAVPGPACYGKGGTDPTVTDANLVLGRLGASTLLGGDMDLDIDAARRAIHDTLAAPLKMSVEQAAEGMITVVNAVMTAAIRKLTVERGVDPREFVLCPFGGAGPLHGAELAVEIGLTKVVVPPAPGVASAFGLLLSPLREDIVRTMVSLLADVDTAEVDAVFAEMRGELEGRLSAVAGAGQLRAQRRAGLRYFGQSYDIPVAVADGTVCVDDLEGAFHREHERLYGFSRPEQPVELVNVWLILEADLGTSGFDDISSEDTAERADTTRSVVFGGKAYDTPVLRREGLSIGSTLAGPVIIEQLDSTTVVPPAWTATVDQSGCMVVKKLS